MDELHEESEAARVEKLAAAKKKLKHFQQKQHRTPLQPANVENVDGRPLSAAFPGYSSESLGAESSKSVDNTKFLSSSRTHQHPQRHSATSEPFPSLRTPTSFNHDDQTSPFQRIKRPSESSECSSTIPQFTSENMSSYVATETTKSDIQYSEGNLAVNKAEPFHIPSTSDNPYNYDRMFFDGQNAEERRTSTDPVVAVDVTLDQRIQASRRDDSHVAYFNNTFPMKIEANFLSTSNKPESSVDTVVAENQRTIQEAFSTIDTNLNQENIQQSNDCYFIEQLNGSTVNFDESVPKLSYFGDGVSLNGQDTADSHRQQNEELKNYCQELLRQFNKLNTHYTQLHSAYAQLSMEHGNNQQILLQSSSMNGNQTALQQQVQQHLQTMSVLVEEKTDLQSQLRQAMEIANSKHMENEELQGRLKANRERLAVLEKEAETQISSKSSLETTLQRQSAELERARKESAQYQAKSTELQQDKSELSARLKARSRELDEIVTKLKETERQMQMKDIYLQQLTGGQQVANVEAYEQVCAENRRLQADMYECRLLNERLKLEANESNQRYESYGRQLNVKVMELSAELEKLLNEKLDVETKLQRTDAELQTLKGKQEESGRDAMIWENSVDKDEFLAMRERNAALKEEIQTLTSEMSTLKSSLLEMDAVVKTTSSELKDRDERIRRYEEFIASSDQTNLNVKSLLEQLHNEKTTSSRAMDQNLTLKNRMIELEEKFVNMSNREMEMSDKLQTAERNVQHLTAHLAEKTNEMENLSVKHEEKYKSLQAQVNSSLKQEYDRKQFEDRLHHFEATQKAVQDELVHCRVDVERLNIENLALRQKLLESEENFSTFRDASENRATGFDRPMYSEEMLTNLRDELTRATQRVQHLAAENAELHRILEQNAEDENQNTIHVELRQAVERMTMLSRENEELRRDANGMREQLEGAHLECKRLNESLDDVLSQQRTIAVADEPKQQILDDHSSVCSEHIDQRREVSNAESFDNMKKAMEQLQSRFTRALTENADLTDQNEQLEHLIMQLQSETETIGEYVTIYQHQRKIIRERLREKEDIVAKLSREKEEIQNKLAELQHLIMSFLKEKGALRTYAQSAPTHERPPRSPPSRLPPRPRNLSETLVDETAKANESTSLLIDKQQPSPSPSEVVISDIANDLVELKSVVQSSPSSEEMQSPLSVDVGTNDLALNGEVCTEHLPTAEKILKLLFEMQRPDLINTLPPIDRSLHCKYCTGRLIML